MCVLPPLRRTPAQSSGAVLNLPCSGSFWFDFDAWIQAGCDPLLTAGQAVQGQYGYRDPAHPDGFGVGLTNAIHFEIGA